MSEIPILFFWDTLSPRPQTRIKPKLESRSTPEIATIFADTVAFCAGVCYNPDSRQEKRQRATLSGRKSKMQELKTLGNYIKEKRTEKGYSQKQLAQMLYVTESAVSKWERGANYPDITMISDLCRVLDISEHELITASNDDDYRQIKRESKLYRRITDAGFITLSVAYAFAPIICFIVNLATMHTLSWFWVVLAGILCAFSFFPSWLRFFKSGKLGWYAVTTFASVALLLLVCGIYTRSVTWVPVAVASVLLGYAAILGPIALKSAKKLGKARFLVYITALFALTLLVLLGARILAVFPIARASLLVFYCYSPFLILGLVMLVSPNRLFSAGAGTTLIGLMASLANYVVSLILPQANMDKAAYTVDFTDWLGHINGNIDLIIMIVSVSLGVGLMVAGIAARSGKSRKK